MAMTENDSWRSNLTLAYQSKKAKSQLAEKPKAWRRLLWR